MFIVYFFISPYDGQSTSRVFSNLEKAIGYCNSEIDSDYIHPKNPFNSDKGEWVIEEHIVDSIDWNIMLYNGDGKPFGKKFW
jgi:hypothetical protein